MDEHQPLQSPSPRDDESSRSLAGQPFGASAPMSPVRLLRQYWPLLLMLAMGTWLRLAGLDYGVFDPDDADVWSLARNLVDHPQLLTQGKNASLGLPMGPFQVYLLLPAFIFGGSPLASMVMVALINMMGVAAFWFFVRSFFGSRMAHVATLLYAVSPWAVVFSRRTWGNDLVAPFVVLTIWSLCNLARRGRARDSVTPFAWAAILIQTYAGAALHLVTLVISLLLGLKRLHKHFLIVGIAVFALLAGPYLAIAVWPRLTNLSNVFGSTSTTPTVDAESLTLLRQLMSLEGYQTLAPQSGAIVDATTGIPAAASMVLQALLALGVLAAAAATISAMRRREWWVVSCHLLPLAAVLLPVALFVRHGADVYPYYIIVGMPMHFLLAALGLRAIARILATRLPRRTVSRFSLDRIVPAALALFVAGTAICMAVPFQRSISQYWPETHYGMPLRYTTQLADRARAVVESGEFERAYVAGGRKPDAVIWTLLRHDRPEASVFDVRNRLLRPAPGESAAYLISEPDTRAGHLLTGLGSARAIDSLTLPGADVKYTLYGMSEADLRSLDEALATGQDAGVTFDQAVRLDRLTIEKELHPGTTQEIVTDWTLLGEHSPKDQPYYLYVRLLDRTGRSHDAGNYYFLDPAQWHAGERIHWWLDLSLPSNLPPGPYTALFGLYTANAQGGFVNALATGPADLVQNGGFVVPSLLVRGNANAAPPNAMSVDFGGEIELLGYDVRESQSVDGASTVTMSLYWQARHKIERDYTVFVHVLNSDGAVVSQHDSQPVEARYPTSAWIPGDTVVDEHVLSVPKDMAHPLRFAVGLYRLDTMERLGGTSAAALVQWP